MNFCPKCSTRLKPRQVKSEGSVLISEACDRCGYYRPVEGDVFAKMEGVKSDRSIKIIGDFEARLKSMPTASIECPKCGGKEAFWWLLQTRGGDEPTTQFYRCTKCEHTWRIYA